jgi:hypothetical protein
MIWGVQKALRASKVSVKSGWIGEEKEKKKPCGEVPPCII